MDWLSQTPMVLLHPLASSAIDKGMDEQSLLRRPDCEADFSKAGSR